MTSEEFEELIEQIKKTKCETRTLELKSASGGCPNRLYDSISAFSNQDDGGIIVFGIDEENGYRECGVYDAQALQKTINEKCLQMEPVVRPLISILEKDDLTFVAAEIPGIDITDRPCYYRGKGRLRGSYIRSGKSDEPMTEYEIYSYEAYRKRHQDDIRPVERATYGALDIDMVDEYIRKLRNGKPNLARVDDNMLRELIGITQNGQVTMSSVMLFSPYPQVYFPKLCITAVRVNGTELGERGLEGERFADNRRIEGNIPEMLEEAIRFVNRNTRNATVIDPMTGKRYDRSEYPIDAVREAVLNALVHRDYSIHTEGTPVSLEIYDDRIEIHNPGGIYGRISAD